MSSPLRRIALTALCATAALGLTACSSTSTGSTAGAAAAASGAASATPAGDSAATPSASASALPNGKKLNSLLLPASALPKGFSINSSDTVNTAEGYNPPVSPSTVPASKACDAIQGTSWITSTGLTALSFAQNDYSDSSQNLIGQEVDGFQGNDAKTAMSDVRKVFAECAHSKIKQNGTAYSAHTTYKTLSGLGDDAVEAVTTSPDLVGGTTLIAVRVGDLVVATLYSDQKTTGAADLALTKRLVANVSAG